MAQVAPERSPLLALTLSIDNHLSKLLPFVRENKDAIELPSSPPTNHQNKDAIDPNHHSKECIKYMLKQASDMDAADNEAKSKAKDVGLNRRQMRDTQDITKSLTMLHSKMMKERDRIRLGVDHNTFMDWKVSPPVAAAVTFRVMLIMYLVTLVFCVFVYAVVNLITLTASDESNSHSDRVSYTKALLTILGGSGYFLSMTLFAFFSSMTTFSIVSVLSMGMPVLFVGFAGFFNPAIFAQVSGYSVNVIFIFLCAAMSITYTYMYIKDKEHGFNYLHNFATKAALRRTGVVQLFQLSDRTYWKVLVTLLALAIKVCGNKGLLILLSRNTPKPWLCDLTLFVYEYATALMCRILQMSIPDTTTAQLISLAAAVVEVATRNFFFVLFLKAGMNNSFWVEKDRMAYAKRAKLRVQDCSNDMVVEYLSTFTTSLFLLYLEPSGVFKFASDEAVSSSTVLMLAAYQLAPEIGLDFYATFMEAFAGLKMVHIMYWSRGAGSDPRSRNFFDRQGDLFKATVTKITMTVAVTCFILIVCIK
ncbi:hypothetical protein TrST_g3911 [Triparma strigata]|uniref:Transmembrane protein n=1 Tax=Triparma strigata TaxID=1606541 RepID=A0A9W7E955_9STRA|nr:hypothetical protein TrST_g3911 [Triparma strigata]